MCGIAGIFNNKKCVPDEQIIGNMAQAIIHRGPDEQGYYRDQYVQLASSRLTIIDLVHGHQPIYTPDKRQCIVYNGEVYNFKEVRQRLQNKGYSFTTATDTEVILLSYKEWGTDCLQYFEGMFAFAIWDMEKQILFLARDRLGIKPLYYASLSQGTVVFASEIKALLQYPGIEKSLHVKAMDNLLSYGFNVAPYTFFEGIKQLLPGHYLIINRNGVVERQYWDIDMTAPLFTDDEETLSRRLKYELECAVKKRLVSDVPVAAYLSGGIDSSAVVGIYSKIAREKITTISITFDHADYNEAHYSREVAQFFGTENIEFKCSLGGEVIKKLIYYLEDPLVTLLNLPLFLLSEKVKELGYKVVLSGDGADEILGGYDYFKLLKAMRFISKGETEFRKNILRTIFPHLPTSVHANVQYAYLKSFPVEDEALPYRFQAFPFKKQLYSSAYKEKLKKCEPEKLFFFDRDKIRHRSLIDQALYLETKMRLLNLTLPLADKMSMANSVELRPSFLDHDFVNFVFRIPDRYKIKGLQEKYIFKKSMRGFLPEAIIARKKQPLQPPGRWFIKETKEMVYDYLSEETVKRKGYFNPQFIAHVLNEYDKQSQADYSGVIIVAFFMHIWDELFL